MKKLLLIMLLVMPMTVTALPYTADGTTFNATHSGRMTDGSTADITGYVVYCGDSPGVYAAGVTFNSPGSTFSALVSDVVSGSGDFVKYCAITSFGADNLESQYSAEVSVNFTSGTVQKTNVVAVPDAPFSLEVK